MKRINMFLFIFLLVLNPLHSVQAVMNHTELIHPESSPDRTANTVDTLIFGALVVGDDVADCLVENGSSIVSVETSNFLENLLTRSCFLAVHISDKLWRRPCLVPSSGGLHFAFRIPAWYLPNGGISASLVAPDGQLLLLDWHDFSGNYGAGVVNLDLSKPLTTIFSRIHLAEVAAVARKNSPMPIKPQASLTCPSTQPCICSASDRPVGLQISHRFSTKMLLRHVRRPKAYLWKDRSHPPRKWDVSLGLCSTAFVCMSLLAALWMILQHTSGQRQDKCAIKQFKFTCATGAGEEESSDAHSNSCLTWSNPSGEVDKNVYQSGLAYDYQTPDRYGGMFNNWNREGGSGRLKRSG